MKKLVILPTYNESKNIIKIIEVFKDNPKFNLHLYGDKKINIKSYDLYKNIENIKFFFQQKHIMVKVVLDW